MLGTAPIRFRGHDGPVHGLEAPAFLDEVRREPVEQLWMRRLLAGAAEVVRISGDGLVEMPEPDPVHDGSGGEWVIGAGDPFGEGLAAAFDGFRYRGLLHATQDAQNARLYFFTRTKGITARQDAG